MPIFTLLFVIILVGVGLYVVNAVIPMDANVKKILNVVVILVLLVWLFDVFIGFGTLGGARVGRRFC
jgi:hypothetical protein